MYFFFVFASFILLVHMMNMLIAIMGDVFNKNREVEKQLQLKNKLKFVVDNQWADPFGKEKESIKYVIAAVLVEEDDDEVENIKLLQEAIQDLKTDQ
jgi:Na+-transporting methylmalonyl-CoA/oxaloacetate decarboxylase gamma subunit